MDPLPDFARPPHILIFEPEASGHQMNYVRFLLREIARELPSSQVTLLTTPGTASHPNCQRVLDEFAGLVTVLAQDPAPDRGAIFRLLGRYYQRQRVHADTLAAGIDAIGTDKIDFVVIPHLESVGLLQLALDPNLVRGKPWATISIAMRFHHRRCGIAGQGLWSDMLQGLLFRRVARDPTLVCFGSVNPFLARAAGNPKVKYCPEPNVPATGSSRGEAREFYGVRSDTCVILVYGLIDHRKCLGLLLDAVALLDADLDVTVLLAGTQHPSIKPVLNSPAARQLPRRDRLVMHDRFIVEGRDADPMIAADIAWVFYERNFVVSSAVLVRAALSGKPVIARRRGVIGRLVQERECGVSAASDAPGDIAASIATLARDPALRERMGRNGIRSFQEHSPENFARPLVESIRQALPALIPDRGDA